MSYAPAETFEARWKLSNDRRRVLGLHLKRMDAAGLVWECTVPVTGPKAYVPQAIAAAVLKVSLVRINEWVRDERIPGVTESHAGISLVPVRWLFETWARRQRGQLGPGDRQSGP